jgi:hypothetical protein
MSSGVHVTAEIPRLKPQAVQLCALLVIPVGIKTNKAKRHAYNVQPGIGRIHLPAEILWAAAK